MIDEINKWYNTDFKEIPLSFKFDEDFLEAYKFKINFDYVLKRQKLSRDFIQRNISILNPYIIVIHQKHLGIEFFILNHGTFRKYLNIILNKQEELYVFYEY